MNNKSVILFVLLISCMMQPLCASGDYVKYAVAAGAATTVAGLTFLAVGIRIGKNDAQRSLEHQQKELEINEQRHTQQQQHAQQEKQQHSKETLKRCSARYNNSRSLREIASSSGMPFHHTAQQCIDDRKSLEEAQLHLEDKQKDECSKLLEQLSQDIKNFQTTDKQFIEQSAKEFQQLQDQENNRKHEQDKKQLELDSLKTLRQQEQATLELIRAQTSAELSKKIAYDTIVPELINIDSRIASLEKNSKNIDQKLEHIDKTTSMALQNTSKNMTRLGVIRDYLEANAFRKLGEYLNNVALYNYGNEKLHGLLYAENGKYKDLGAPMFIDKSKIVQKNVLREYIKLSAYWLLGTDQKSDLLKNYALKQMHDASQADNAYGNKSDPAYNPGATAPSTPLYPSL